MGKMRAPIIGILCFVLVSCNSSSSNLKNATRTPVLPQKPKINIKLPIQLQPSHLAYIKADTSIILGDSVQATLQRFQRPSGAIRVEILPPPLTAPLKAYGWQSEQEALGLIAQDYAVVLLIHTEYRTTPLRRRTVIAEYEARFKPPTRQLIDIYSEYRFWEANNQRLMISSAKNLKGEWNLTVALGEVSLMNALRMNPEDAAVDQAKAKTLLF